MERELEKHPQKDGIKTEYRCGFTCVGSWATRIEKWKEFKYSSIGKYILSCESEINRLKEENKRLNNRIGLCESENDRLNSALNTVNKLKDLSIFKKSQNKQQ